MTEDRDLHERAKQLGNAAAERLDVEAVARNVVRRLREAPVEKSAGVWRAPGWLRIAAAIVVLVGGALLARQIAPGGDGHVAHFVAEDLTDLSTEELREVLQMLEDTSESGRAAPSDSSLDELDAQQLRAVLRSLEG